MSVTQDERTPEPTKSTYVRPSASVTRAPSPRATNNGLPPTARHERTGLLTPPE
jgi:hypothetical protein